MNTVKTIIKKKISYDIMTIQAKLPSGASLKFSINRSGERLEVAFSNNTIVLKEQTDAIQNWLKLRKGENNEKRIDRLEAILRVSKSGAEVINNLTKF